jgi:hypothetical protein
LNRRVVWAIALGVVLIGAATAGLRMMFPSRFDSVRWRTADSPSTFAARRDMMRDVNRLISDHQITSKTTAMQQLGSPQSGDAQSDTWLYDLGPDTNASAPGPHQWLELKFDAGDNLVSHGVRRE